MVNGLWVDEFVSGKLAGIIYNLKIHVHDEGFFYLFAAIFIGVFIQNRKMCVGMPSFCLNQRFICIFFMGIIICGN